MIFSDRIEGVPPLIINNGRQNPDRKTDKQTVLFRIR